MRPADYRQRSKAKALSTAATLYRSAFEPLRGFPFTPGRGRQIWIHVPASGGGEGARPLSVTPSLLHEAAATAGKLPLRFPSALPRLVGDLERWRRVCTENLSCLRAACDAGLPLPALPPSARASDYAGLPALLASTLSWVFAFNPLGLAAVLRHREPAAAACASAGARLATPHALARLVRWLELLAGRAAAGAVGVFDLWQCDGAWDALVVPDAVERQRHDDDDASTRRARGGEAAAACESLGQTVFDLAPLLATASMEARARALQVLRLVATPAVVREWRTWRAANAATAASAPAHGARGGRRGNQPPPQPIRREALHALVRDVLAADARVVDEALRVLERLPEVLDRAFVRYTLLAGWMRVTRVGDFARLLLPWLRAFAAYARSPDFDSTALGPWRRPLRAARRGESWDDDLPMVVWRSYHAEDEKPVAARFFAALRRLREPSPWQADLRRSVWDSALGRLSRLCAVLADAGAVAQHADALERAIRSASAAGVRRHGFPIKVLPLALSVAGGDPGVFAALVPRIASQPELLDFCHEDGWGAVPDVPPAHARWLGESLLAGNVADVAAILVLARSAKRHGIDVSATLSGADAAAAAATADAMAVLPAGVRADVAVLAERVPHAFASALAQARLLVPDHAALTRELRAIDDRLAAAPEPRRTHLLRRRGTLAERLAAPPEQRPAAADKWLRKVERQAKGARLASWQQALRVAITAAVEGRMGLTLPSAWWADAALHDILANLTALPEEFRRLGGRILAAVAAGTWRGFLDDPRNHSWIERMRAAGVAIAAWLRGPTPSRIEHADHGALTLVIEDDPLQILQMGAWFRTCLTPGNANFYSTTVVAADANKRLLCLRNARGAVLGRCILAIDVDRRLRVFEPYSHDADLGFDRLVGDVAAQLAAAARIGTPGTAPVEVLTASRWYDDGEHRVRGLVGALLADPAAEQRLVAGPDTGVIDLLRAHFDAHCVRTAAALAACETRLVEQHPRLAGPMLEIIDLPHSLTPWEHGWILRLAAASGRMGVLRRLAERFGRVAGCYEDVARAWLILNEPSRALRVLRAELARRRRHDPSGTHLFLAARANDLLHRRRLALHLYREALPALGADASDRAMARERIRALAADS